MLEAPPEYPNGAPGELTCTPWLFPIPLPPALSDVLHKATDKEESYSSATKDAPSLDLNPGAPEYLWSVAKTKRLDGRDLALQLRPLQAETSLFSSADGSCKLFQGDTCIVAHVTGPVASSLRRNTNLSEAFCEVLVRPRTGAPQLPDKRLEYELQHIVQRAVNVQLYPRTTIQIVVQVVGEDGPLLSACSNAMCLALLDAGINLRYTFAAVCIASRPIIEIDGRERNAFIVDPLTTELNFCTGAFCLVFDISTGGLVASSPEQDLMVFSMAEMEEFIRLGYSATLSVGEFFRLQMEKSLESIETTIHAQNWYETDT